MQGRVLQININAPRVAKLRNDFSPKICRKRFTDEIKTDLYSFPFEHDD